MNDYSVFVTICTLACVIGLGIMVVAPGLFLGSRMAKDFNKQLDAERLERDKYKLSILESGGVLAPAVVVSARKVRSWGGGKHSMATSFIVDYQVEVTPADGPSFRTAFRDELYTGNYRIIKGEMVSEVGRKLWVTYDPKDTARAYLDHYDENHQEGLANRRYLKARSNFIDMEKEAIRVRETGVEALAVILEMEELGAENEKETKEGKAVRIKFRVMPQLSAEFESETYAMLALESIQKVTAGRKAYVKYDPQKPEISALMRLGE